MASEKEKLELGMKSTTKYNKNEWSVGGRGVIDYRLAEDHKAEKGLLAVNLFLEDDAPVDEKVLTELAEQFGGTFHGTRGAGCMIAMLGVRMQLPEEGVMRLGQTVYEDFGEEPPAEKREVVQEAAPERPLCQQLRERYQVDKEYGVKMRGHPMRRLRPPNEMMASMIPWMLNPVDLVFAGEFKDTREAYMKEAAQLAEKLGGRLVAVQNLPEEDCFTVSIDMPDHSLAQFLKM